MPLPFGNRLLDALPPADARRLAALSKIVRLERGDRTATEGVRMHNVDFPVTALMSVAGLLEDGTTVEVATVGSESFVEIDAALECDIALRNATCQFAGDSVRFKLDDFQAALDACRPFAVRVRRSIRARAFVSEQLQMCNVRHTIRRRLARWLLMAAERLGQTEFSVTHDFLAGSLGVRRAGITTALSRFQAAGAISLRRGLIAITDDRRLTAITCECFEACRRAVAESLDGA
ncbi:MAG TPA: Crp/Fnr family transcriptional regulator [Candidatus Elarobacter sp.]|nr:Crp/Fnr family transcriptional regulator [Candidatus Elarobacter sp.]